MTVFLALAAILATPQLEHARDCPPSPTVGWENALYVDGSDGLFRQEAFLPVTEWGDDTPGDPTASQLVADCFGASAPHSRAVVLHHLAPAPDAPPRDRPVLLVPGAGDNAIRSYTFMALTLRLAGFEVYAITFAHRHGDNFLQAEQVANALAVIGARHPDALIDVVAHSKGGMPTRIYASNHPGADWSAVHPAYDARGTRYRGDIGRLFFFGAPLAGLDTSFRWPSANFFPVYGVPLDSPGSWRTFFTAGNPFLPVDLEPYSLYGGADGSFPGQAQMLAPWDEVYDLPGSNPLLGVYASVQQDWFTTYYGGFGFVSESDGIGDAIEESGGVVEALQRTGVDPDIDLYVVGGGNPILSSAGFGGLAFASWFADGDAAARRNFWEDGVAAVLDLYFPWWPAFEDELPRLVAGTAFLGEISGPSDGVLFVDSALDESGITLRGAEVLESRFFPRLNHVELLAAGVLFAAFHEDPENGFFDPELAAKYRDPDNQILEWLVEILSRPVPVEGDPDPEPDPGDAAVGPPDAMAPDAMPPDAGADAMAPDTMNPDAASPDAEAEETPDAGAMPPEMGRDAMPADTPDAGEASPEAGAPPPGAADAGNPGADLPVGCAAAPGAPSDRWWLVIPLLIGGVWRQRQSA